MILPRVATGIVIIDDLHRILLLQRAQTAATGGGDWAIPGGKLDPGETLAVCAARETREETAIRVRSVQRLDVVTEDMEWGPANHFVTLYYATRDWAGTASIMEPHKHTALKWIGHGPLVAAIKRQDPDFRIFGPLVDLHRAGGLTQAMRK